MDMSAYVDFIKAKCANEETINQECGCIPLNNSAAFRGYEMLNGNRMPFHGS